MASKQRCQGKRRMQRGRTFGTYKCGRVARYVFQTYVGLSRSHYTCGDDECTASLTHGYGANNYRAVAS